MRTTIQIQGSAGSQSWTECPYGIENVFLRSFGCNYNSQRGNIVRAKETLFSILDHFLILSGLIATDLILKAVLHFQKILDVNTTTWINQILSYFLIAVVLIFAVFGCIQLSLQAFKTTRDTVSDLFPKEVTQEIETQRLDGEPK